MSRAWMSEGTPTRTKTDLAHRFLCENSGWSMGFVCGAFLKEERVSNFRRGTLLFASLSQPSSTRRCRDLWYACWSEWVKSVTHISRSALAVAISSCSLAFWVNSRTAAVSATCQVLIRVMEMKKIPPQKEITCEINTQKYSESLANVGTSAANWDGEKSCG